MRTSSVEHERRFVVADRETVQGDYVLYWMQSAVRTRHNQALEFAAQRANRLGVPLVVCFAIIASYPESSARHHLFMVEGLGAIVSELERRRIGLRIEIADPLELVDRLAGQATEVVTDRGYLRHHRTWREHLSQTIDRRIIEIETNVVIPVEVVSDKREYAARTIRPKIHNHMSNYLVDLATTALLHDGRRFSGGVDVANPATLIERLNFEQDVGPSTRFTGGQYQARAALNRFLRGQAAGYADGRGEPSTQAVSSLSPYLHFGHISPIVAVMAAERAGLAAEDHDSFIEELVVRRELAHNYVWFEPDYDSFHALPRWARTTLLEHSGDPRTDNYSRDELEHGETHDRYWNAAMAEMRHTGYLHNYMRMYWGKRILEWSDTPESGFDTALAINNKYLLDGRDPNSYAGVGWCFGLHDRAWNQRDVFGKVRSMTAGGLRRKKNVEGYVRLIESLTGTRIGPSEPPDR